MSRSVRPGSLIVLAVIDFVWALGGLISTFGQLLALAFKPQVAVAEGGVQPGDVLALQPDWYTWGHLAYSPLTTVLLVIAGIGALTVRSWSGRWCANAYAVLSLAWSITEIYALSHMRVTMFANVVTALAVVYPVITLVWINLVLRDVWRGERLADGVVEAVPPAGWPRPGFAARLALTCMQSLRQSLRGSMGLGLLLTVLIGGLIGVLSITGAEEVARDFYERLTLTKPDAPTLDAAHLGLAEGLLKGWHRAGAGSALDYAAWAKHLVQGNPPLLSFSWLLLSVLVPLLVVLGGCNLIAADAAHRGFRFLLLRTDRTSLWFGRFLGAAILVAISLLVLVACTGFLVGRSEVDIASGSRAVPLATTLAASAWAFLALLLTALPYLALAQLLSTLINSGFGALAIVTAITGAVPGLAFALAAKWPALWHVMHLLPWGSQILLFHPHAGIAAGAAAACLAYTALFLWLGWRHFRRRDL